MKKIILTFLVIVLYSQNALLAKEKSMVIFPIIVGDITVIVKGEIDNTPIPVDTYLKKTGQIESYNQDGIMVARGQIRDDGYYKKGKAPNYTRAFYDGIVTDYIVGLQWQDNVYAHGSWVAAKNYCNDLTLGGYSDWRLPTRKELYSLVEYWKDGAFINSIFYNDSASRFWSSTYIVGYNNFVWTIDFSDGSLQWGNIWQDYYVRCVRKK